MCTLKRKQNSIGKLEPRVELVLKDLPFLPPLPFTLSTEGICLTNMLIRIPDVLDVPISSSG